MRFLTVILAVATLSLGAFAGDGEQWVADFDQALQIAKKEGKDLLVDFTGSDWCGWCIRLDQEVFDTPAFQKEAPKHFVLTALDFPRGEEAKARVPNPERNEELSQKFGVTGFPTIVLVTADGEPYARTGYREGGPEKYLEHLTELRTKGREALAHATEVVKLFETAPPSDKWQCVEKAVGILGNLEPGDPVAMKLTPILLATIEGDMEESRKVQALEALLEAGNTDDSVISAARSLDPKNEKGLLERVVKAKLESLASLEDVKAIVAEIAKLDAMGDLKDPEVAAELYTAAAVLNSRYLEKPEEAKRFAKKAMDFVGDDDPKKQMIQEVLDQ